MQIDPSFLDLIEVMFAFPAPFIIVAIFGNIYLIYNLRGRNVLSLGESLRRGDHLFHRELTLYKRRDQLTRFERAILYSQFACISVLAFCGLIMTILVVWYIGPQIFAKLKA